MTKIPVVPSLLPMGHVKEYVADPLAFLEKNRKKYGDIYRFRVAHRYLIATFNPDHVGQLLQEDHTAYRKNPAYRKLKILLGDGLFTGDGKSWLQQRRLAQPAFHREMLSGYMAFMQSFAEDLTNGWSDKKEISATSEMTAVTLRIISKALLNIDLQREQNSIIENHLPYALDFMIKRITTPINWPMSIPLKSHRDFKKSVGQMNTLIRQLIQERRESNLNSKDLLGMLMKAQDAETGAQMNDKQLRDEILTFFLAGHETTAMAMTWMLYWLAIHPKIQEKVRTEVLEIKSIDAESLSRLPYTRNVIKETLRLMSPVWIMGREALRPIKLGNHPIQKGDSIIFSPYLIHRHPDYWQSPEEFNPDRFMPGKEEAMHKYAYFPFGGGPRLCIGNNFAMMEMQILIVEILKKFRFSLKDFGHPGFHLSLTLRPKKEINLLIKSVENSNRQVAELRVSV